MANPDETVDLTLTYLNDEGEEVEYTETVTYRGLAEVLSTVERNATSE
jgi:transcription elongation factor